VAVVIDQFHDQRIGRNFDAQAIEMALFAGVLLRVLTVDERTVPQLGNACAPQAWPLVCVLSKSIQAESAVSLRTVRQSYTSTWSAQGSRPLEVMV